jgi:hypothetical protein
MLCLFARGGGYDAPFPFDCLVSTEEKALLSDGEQGYLVGIMTVPDSASIGICQKSTLHETHGRDARQRAGAHRISSYTQKEIVWTQIQC